jgi:Lon protease-like protein
MIYDALQGNRIIGMVMLQPGHEAEYEGNPPIYSIGCAGVIDDVEELPDGRYNIRLSALVKFRIVSEDQRRVYRLARVEALPEVLNESQKAALREQRTRLLALFASVSPNSSPPPGTLSDEGLVNGMAQYLAFDPVDRQALLERENPLARSQGLIDLLEKKAARPR